MIAAFSPFLALRYLVTRRINLLGIGGVMFAVWATLVVDGVFTGFVFEIQNDVRRATPDLLVTDLPAETDYARLQAAIDADQHVLHSAPRLRHYAVLQALRPPRQHLGPGASEVDFDQMQGGFALLLGIDPLREAEVTDVGAWLQRGVVSLRSRGITSKAPTVMDEPDPERRAELLLPDAAEWSARERTNLPREEHLEDFRSAWPGVLLGWRRYPYAQFLREADPIELLTGMYPPGSGPDAPVSTRHKRLAFAGFFGTGYRLFDETTALLPIETLRTLLGHDLSDPRSKQLITDVAIRLQPGLSPAAWRACQQRLQAAVQAQLPAGSPSCSVLDWRQQNTVFLTAVNHEHKMMQFVLFVVMLVAAFVIYATLHMMVVQKWKDVGILAAVGGDAQSIGAVFLFCGLAVGTLGSALGAGLGLLTTTYLNDVNEWLYRETGLELFPRTLFDLPTIPCHLTAGWVATVAVGAVVLALLVSYLPARRAARMNPVQALSYE